MLPWLQTFREVRVKHVQLYMTLDMLHTHFSNYINISNITTGVTDITIIYYVAVKEFFVFLS